MIASSLLIAFAAGSLYFERLPQQPLRQEPERRLQYLGCKRSLLKARKYLLSTPQIAPYFSALAKNASRLPLPAIAVDDTDVHESDEKQHPGTTCRSGLSGSEVKTFTAHTQPAKVRTLGQAKSSILLTVARGFPCSDAARI